MGRVAFLADTCSKMILNTLRTTPVDEQQPYRLDGEGGTLTC